MHFNTCRNARPASGSQGIIARASSSEIPEPAGSEDLAGIEARVRYYAAPSRNTEGQGLQAKLMELENERDELSLRRSRVDEDVQAVKRAMELIAA
jgi:hypothetical protein